MATEQAMALAALCDPSLPAVDLVRIASRWPDLWQTVAEHPGAYPSLLTWLVDHGDADVQAVVASRNGRTAPEPVPPLPSPVEPGASTTELAALDAALGWSPPAPDAWVAPAPPPPVRVAASSAWTSEETVEEEVGIRAARSRRRRWLGLLTAAVIVVALALVAWFVVVPWVRARSVPASPTGTWSEPIGVTAAVTQVLDGGAGVLVVANDQMGVAQGVDAARGTLLWTLDVGDLYGQFVVARSMSVARGEPSRLAVGYITSGGGCLLATTDDPRRAPGPAADVGSVGNCYLMNWAASTLVVSGPVETVGLANGDPGQPLWMVPGTPGAWIGTEAFSTGAGVIRATDGSKAPYGADASLTGYDNTTYFGPPGHLLRATLHRGQVDPQGTTGECDAITLQGWDPVTDQATWSAALSFTGQYAYAYDPHRRQDVVLTLTGVRGIIEKGPAGTDGTVSYSFSCGVERGQGLLSAYAITDGALLWSTVLPAMEGACWFQASPGAAFVALGLGADTAGRAVVINCQPQPAYQTDVVPESYVTAVFLADGTPAVSTPGWGVTTDASGAEFIVANDLSTVSAYNLNAPDAPLLWQVLLPRRSVSGNPAVPNDAARYFGAGGYVVAATDKGLVILR